MIFCSDDPSHYISGFPWHPHRGIETITYVLQGDPQGMMKGFQLWANLPAHTTFEHPTKPGHLVLAYVISGSGSFGEPEGFTAKNEELVLFEDGQDLITGLSDPVRHDGPLTQCSTAVLQAEPVAGPCNVPLLNQ
ncbi:MAG: pirin family protein [Thermoleophilia bacterium]